MSIRCLLNGLEVNYPCSPVCDLYGDCCAVYNKLNESRVQTNADRMIQMIQDGNAGGLVAMWEGIFEDGVPTDDYMRWWLQQPAEVE